MDHVYPDTVVRSTHLHYIAKTILGGPTAEIDAVPDAISAILAKASFLLGKQASAIAISSPIPAVFCVRDLPKAIVVYTPRYIELNTALRYAILTDVTSDERKALGWTFFSEVLAGNLVRRGMPDTALRVFLGSWLCQQPIMTGSQWHLPNILSEPDGLAMLANLGFGLSHEVGHSMELVGNSRPWLSRGVEDMLVDLLAISNDDSLRPHPIGRNDQQRLLKYAKGIRDHPLNPDFIVDEVAADFFAWDTLWNATYDICVETGDEFDDVRLLTEICGQMMVLFLFERSDTFARSLSHHSQTWEDRVGYAFQDVSINLRMNHLAGSSSRMMAKAHYGEAAAGRNMAFRFGSAIDEMHGILNPALAEVERGVHEAMGIASMGESYDSSLRQLLLGAEHRLGAKDPYFAQDVAVFCGLTRDSSAPGVSALREMYVRSRAASAFE